MWPRVYFPVLLFGLAHADTHRPTATGIANTRHQSIIEPRIGLNPNPCNDAAFVPPIYDISAIKAEKSFLDYPQNVPGPTKVGFRLSDIANKYSMLCSWSVTITTYMGREGGYTSRAVGFESDCVPENDPGLDKFMNRFLTNISTTSTTGDSNQAVALSQIWVCEPINGHYPYLYEAEAGASITTSCPQAGQINSTVPCNVTSVNLPPTRAIWRPPVNSTKLQPHSVSSPDSFPPEFSKPGRCATTSFSYPNWVVDDFASSGPTNFNFTVTSSASGAQIRCRVSKAENDALEMFQVPCRATRQDDSSKADPVSGKSELKVAFNITSNEISIDHEWICFDAARNHSVPFTAHGSSILPLLCHDDSSQCKLKPLTIRGSLTRPVQLAPARIPPPPNALFPGCMAASTNASWLVTALSFVETSASYAPYQEQLFELIVRNNANNLTISCRIYGNSGNLVWWPNAWNLCDPPAEHSVEAYSPYQIKTYVRVEPRTGQFALNQTWYCSESEGSTSVSFTSYASVYNDSGFSCLSPTTDAGWCNNPTRQNPELVNERCIRSRCIMSVPSITLHGTITNRTSLPNKAFTEPDSDPNAYSCTASSAGHPVTWNVTYFRFSTRWYRGGTPNLARTYGGFNLWSSAIPDAGNMFIQPSGTALTPYQPASDPSVQYTNFPGSFFIYYTLYDSAVRINLATGYMEVNQSWYCEDKNPAQPVIFNATWNGYIPLNCGIARWVRPDRYSEEVSCKLEDDWLVLRPVVKWYTSEKSIPELQSPRP